jgi:hypothetical protein
MSAKLLILLPLAAFLCGFSTAPEDDEIDPTDQIVFLKSKCREDGTIALAFVIKSAGIYAIRVDPRAAIAQCSKGN